MGTMRTLHTGAEVTIGSAIAAAPAAPYADDLVSIAGLKSGGNCPKAVAIQITRQTGSPVLGAPVLLVGKLKGRIVKVATLNAGAAISPTADLGYQEVIAENAALCDELCVVPASLTGSTSYNAFAVAVHESGM